MKKMREDIEKAKLFLIILRDTFCHYTQNVINKNYIFLKTK